MKKSIVLSLLFVFTCQFFTHAQWLEKKGNGYFKLSAWSLEADPTLHQFWKDRPQRHTRYF